MDKEKKLVAVYPETLVLITDPSHWLYDPRANASEGLEEWLVLSIMDHGVERALSVVRDDAGNLLVHDGRCRVRHCIEANRRLKAAGKQPQKVWCEVKTGDEVSLCIKMLVANSHVPETPISVARKVARSVAMGASIQDAAVAIGKTPNTVRNMLKLLSANPKIIEAVEDKVITTAVAYKLARLPRADQKTHLKAVIEKSKEHRGELRSIFDPPEETASRPRAMHNRAIMGAIDAARGKESAHRMRPWREVKHVRETLASRLSPESLDLLRFILGEIDTLPGYEPEKREKEKKSA